MAFGFLKPVTSLNGLPCTGHGLCLPSTVHSVQACGSPPIPYTIVIKNKTCWWPPTPLFPYYARPRNGASKQDSCYGIR